MVSTKRTHNHKNKLSTLMVATATLSLTLASPCSSFVPSLIGSRPLHATDTLPVTPVGSMISFRSAADAIENFTRCPTSTSLSFHPSPSFGDIHGLFDDAIIKSGAQPRNNNNRYKRTNEYSFVHRNMAPSPASTSSSTKLESSFSEVLETLDGTSKSNKIQKEEEIDEEEEEMNAITTVPPYAAQTIDGRLLCASQCAYEISPPYFRACAYRPGTTAKRVTRGVNSALIGCTVDGITIAFRGTKTSSLLDWLQNAALFLSDVDEEKYKLKGRLHTGFYRGTKSLWKSTKSVLKEMVAECEEKGWKTDVHITGHSKGGAMASIAAILMKRDKDLPDPKYICTFASARVGNSEFRDAYNARLNQTSYEAHLDLIPFLPPSKSTMENMSDAMSEMIEGVLWSETSSSKKEKYRWDYQTLGQRKFIREDGSIVNDVTRELDAQRIRDIEEKSILSLDEFKQAHCSGCASDGCDGLYFAAVADGVCDVMCDEE
mmetsp:Transcript_29569/g.45139  ORF Transcript_29569/g.45139 Transcript_29569/m.45139 type:complete len:489 (-) Transcript_29569:309-1775(-)